MHLLTYSCAKGGSEAHAQNDVERQRGGSSAAVPFCTAATVLQKTGQRRPLFMVSTGRNF